MRSRSRVTHDSSIRWLNDSLCARMDENVKSAEISFKRFDEIDRKQQSNAAFKTKRKRNPSVKVIISVII